MMKFKKGDHVEKFSGDYRGPGIVHIADLDDNGKPLYVVKFKIEGGQGFFYHIMREQQLRLYERRVIFQADDKVEPYCERCLGPCLRRPRHGEINI